MMVSRFCAQATGMMKRVNMKADPRYRAFRPNSEVDEETMGQHKDARNKKETELTFCHRSQEHGSDSEAVRR